MEKYSIDKASAARVQPYEDVIEDSGEGKTLPVKTLSGSWLRSMLLTVETRGIQRVTEEERQQNTSKVWNACTFWYDSPTPKPSNMSDKNRLSANMAVATLNVGSIGGAMGLSFWDCFAIIVVVNIVSCMIPAWTAGFGLTGLRMTSFS